LSPLVFAVAAMTGAREANAAPAQFKGLHSFSGTDGGSWNSLIQTADGLFYGSAANGGDINSYPADGCGLLFKSDSAGNVTVLHVFHATDGNLPTGLVKGSDGNFFGTTASGDQPSGGGGGTFFRMEKTVPFEDGRCSQKTGQAAP
jgi:uncharacterized repeat protein (TIGR03803 family)